MANTVSNSIPINRYVTFLTLAGCGFALDIWSKSAVFSKLGYPGGYTEPFLDGWLKFRFYTSFNHGALWGMGQGYSLVFAGLSFIAIFTISYWLFVKRAALSWWINVALGLVMSGILGNLYDRMGLHGYLDPQTEKPIQAVRDFFLFTFGTYNWPVFNVADICLVTGACMLILHSLFAEPPGTVSANKEAENPEGSLNKESEESGEVPDQEKQTTE